AAGELADTGIRRLARDHARGRAGRVPADATDNSAVAGWGGHSSVWSGDVDAADRHHHGLGRCRVEACWCRAAVADCGVCDCRRGELAPAWVERNGDGAASLDADAGRRCRFGPAQLLRVRRRVAVAGRACRRNCCGRRSRCVQTAWRPDSDPATDLNDATALTAASTANVANSQRAEAASPASVMLTTTPASPAPKAPKISWTVLIAAAARPPSLG